MLILRGELYDEQAFYQQRTMLFTARSFNFVKNYKIPVALKYPMKRITNKQSKLP